MKQVASPTKSPPKGPRHPNRTAHVSGRAIAPALTVPASKKVPATIVQPDEREKAAIREREIAAKEREMAALRAKVMSTRQRKIGAIGIEKVRTVTLLAMLMDINVELEGTCDSPR